MTAATCPITVRCVTALLDSGLAAYGEPAWMTIDLPVETVMVADEPAAGPVRLWRFDVDATVPQSADRAAAFQEQRAFAAHRALDVTLDFGAVGEEGEDGTLLALYQHKEWWMRPAWVAAPADLPARTQLVLRRTVDGGWLALVALCDADARADFSGLVPQPDRVARESMPPAVGGAGQTPAPSSPAVEDRPSSHRGIQSSAPCADSAARASAVHLTVATNRVGRTAIRETVGYMALAGDPYAAIRAAVTAAARRLGIATRADRPFPAALNGLGWCTWDSLGRDVSEAAIIAKMEEFAAKRVPIAWVLIDDGWSHTDRERETLLDFGADTDRFPHGLAHTVDLLTTRFGVRHVGVWQAYQGYWRGVAAHGEAAALTRGDLVATGNGCMIPAPDAARTAAFWDAWDARLAADGIDFVKVDSQSSTSVMTRGTESYGESSRGRHRALDEVTGRRFAGALINCMGMAPEDYWHRPSSPITRSSDDYLPHHPESLAEHILQNAYCALLMGELYHCDWDMFWTDHPHARTHAILRALSGGPVYCSDAVGRTDPSVLLPLLDGNGDLPRPDEPARPVVDSLLRDPTRSDCALGVATRFGDTHVVAFVGLRDRPQTGRGRALDAPLVVTDTADGRTVTLAAGDELTCTVGIGETRVFSFRHTGK